LLGLSGVGARYLKPTLRVHAWLAGASLARQRALWEAFLAHDRRAVEAWRVYRWPSVGDRDPLSGLHELVAALGALAEGQTVSLEAFLDDLERRAPTLYRTDVSYASWSSLGAETRARYKASVRRWVTTLLVQPLSWFGFVRVGDGAPGDEASDRTLGLTALGAALLRGPAEAAPPGVQDRGREQGGEPAPAQKSEPVERGRAWLRLEGREEAGEASIAVHAAPDAPLAVLWSLHEIVEEQEGRTVLTARSLLRALDRGRTAEDVIEQLERDGGEALSPSLLHLLYTWAERRGEVVLRQATILETRDPALLQELAAARRVRDKFTGTLSQRAVTVDASAVDLLVRQMERRGLHVTRDVIARDASSLAAPPLSESASADRVTVVAALELASRLGREAGVRVNAPWPLIRDWKAALSPAERDAVEGWVGEVQRGLQSRRPRSMEDYRPPFEAPPRLSLLERAIAAGATVEIEYHAPGRAPTVRRVDPLRLERWGRRGVDYLIGFCHERGEERTFRVDRMARIEVAGGSPLGAVGQGAQQ
jgi:hypothetical protein